METTTLASSIAHGRTLIREQRPRESATFLKSAVERFPSDPELRLLYGTALVAVGSPDAAWQLAESAALSPDDPRLLTRAASQLYYACEYAAARDYAQRALSLAPEDFELYSSLVHLGAQLAVVDGSPALAEEGFQAAVDLEPDNPLYIRDFARFLVSQGRGAEAISAIDGVLARVDDADLSELRAQLSNG
jgi:Flp pilus assembly protein TadD